MTNSGYTLEGLIRSVDHCTGIHKTDLCPGDWVVVRTLRSVYRIRVRGGGMYEVAGGWFDQRGRSPVIVSIVGCTWGGSAVRVDSVAVCGLSIEFSNRLITSAVQQIFVFPSSCLN